MRGDRSVITDFNSAPAIESAPLVDSRILANRYAAATIQPALHENAAPGADLQLHDVAIKK
jgi:hypothetical protein